MSININNDGRNIAIIKDSTKHKNIVFSVSEEKAADSKLKKSFDSLEIDDGTFQLIPDKKRDRDTIMVVGSAGSGKSFFVGMYLNEYKRIHKNNPIYLISEGKEDPALDKVKGLKRIKLDDGLLEEPIQYDEFKDCCVVFDDTDALTGKLGKYIYSLRDKLLKNARKNKVSVITTNHTCTGQELKAVLNESDTIVFFMKNYNRALKYLLENYVGLNKEGIKNLKKNKSRWTCFIKSYPNVIIQEKNITTLEKIQEF